MSKNYRPVVDRAHARAGSRSGPISAKELLDATQSAVHALEKIKGVKEIEAYASTNQLNILRMAYATNVPSNGLEEPKSLTDFGLSIRVLFSDGKIGFGKQPSDISLAAAKKAFDKARKNTVLDTDFKSLPSPGKKKPVKCEFDKQIVQLNPEKAVDAAYACLNGAIDFLEKKKFYQNLNITGELDFFTEKMAISNSNGVKASDQNTAAIGKLTTIFELDKTVSGMAHDSNVFMKKINPYKIGSESAEKAFSLMNPTTMESGEHKVVFGRTAVAELMYSRFEVGLGSIEVNATPFGLALLDKQIASEQLSVSDNGIMEGSIGTKSVTDEGLATQNTKLVDKGTLVNFLSNDYYKKKFSEIERTVPSNGFRFGGGGRHYSAEPGISHTNIEIQSGRFSDEELIKEVGNGIYIGRLWYTYPVNGLASADFTSTVRGDSFLIENGEKTTPVTPNTLRINENLSRLFMSIIGLSKQKKQVIAWGEDAVVVTPEIAVSKARLEKIAVGLYS